MTPTLDGWEPIDQTAVKGFMPRRRVILLLLLTTGLALSGVAAWRGWSAFNGPSAPIIVETVGAQRAFLEQALSDGFREIGRAGKHARLVGNRYFHVSQGGLPPELLLSVGDTVSGPPDHHAGSSFEVAAIDDTGVTLTYRSQFDHRSFGKSLITVDRGTVRISWKSRPAASTRRSALDEASSSQL